MKKLNVKQLKKEALKIVEVGTKFADLIEKHNNKFKDHRKQIREIINTDNELAEIDKQLHELSDRLGM